jgi:hypothetical protein
MALNWDAIRYLSIPTMEYAVVGSGVLEAHGIREAADTEIVCTDKQYRHLASLPGTVAKRWDNGNICLIVSTPAGVVEVNCADSYSGGNFPGLDTILNSAEIIDGVSFIGLHAMRSWKATAARPKDLSDVAVIDAYLASGRSL